MLDIPEEDVRRVDPSRMADVLAAWPAELEKALASARAITFTPARRIANVCVAGMGGSAIGGEFLATWADRGSKVPVAVSRDYTLPSWVGADTLVVATSFSGNTEETLSAFVDAKKRGAMLAAISTGGKIEEFAKHANVPFIKVEGGIPPRSALPRMLVPTATILERAGVLATRAGLEDALAAMREEGDALGPATPADKNEAKRVALALDDTVAAIYGSGPLVAVARRFANDVQENGKMLAWWGAVPEANHNEVVAWGGDHELDRATAVFLRHDGEDAQTKEHFAFTGELVQKRGGRLVQIAARGDTIAAKMLTTAWLGSLASVYLAARRGVDPAATAHLAELKGRLAQTGFAASLSKGLGR
ncbi:MAG: bifunctional phosphoglucose/phosphomannose isomerase [Thermoplasmatota archaeon]